jgi:hypothetical protein
MGQYGCSETPSLLFDGFRGLSLGVKRPVREADHSPASSAEVNNAWCYTSTPQYVLMVWCLVKHNVIHDFEHVTCVRSTATELSGGPLLVMKQTFSNC